MGLYPEEELLSIKRTKRGKTMEPQTLHQESIVIDGHCDTLLRWQAHESSRKPLPPPSGETRGHIDLDRLKKGGITAQNFACYIRPQYLPGRATHQTLRLIDLFYRLRDEHANELCLATRAADIERAKDKTIVAGLLSMEGAEGLEGDLGVVRTMYRLGVRWIGLTWNYRNQAADGLFEMRTGGGLTEFGVRLVEEMNRLGMIVDIAHLAPAGVRDVLATSEAPVVASHANAHAVCPVPRNLSDEQLEGIAETGGVVGITYVPDFIRGGEKSTADRGPATLDMLLDHMDHIVRVAGIDHIGLGSDFDGFGDSPPDGLEDVSCVPNVTAALLRRGYSDKDIRKILGGNWLRVIRQVMGS
jgi:membrane dipeptidase